MTITVAPARNEYTANAGQTIFNYTFKIFADTDLNVYITPAGQDANDSTDLTTAYTVTGLGDEDGGTIILSVGTNANDLVTIVSNVPSSRTTDYQNNGDFRPPVVNADFDRVVSIAKKVEDVTNRTLVLPQAQQGSKPLTLPPPEASKILVWNGNEDGVENKSLEELDSTLIPSGQVSRTFSFVNEMVNDPDIKVGDKVVWQGYYAESDGGSNWGVVKSGVHTEDGGSVFSIDANTYVQANLKGPKVSVLKFGAKGNDPAFDDAPFINALDAYIQSTGWTYTGAALGGSHNTGARQEMGFATRTFYLGSTVNMTSYDNTDFENALFRPHANFDMNDYAFNIVPYNCRLRRMRIAEFDKGIKLFNANLDGTVVRIKDIQATGMSELFNVTLRSALVVVNEFKFDLVSHIANIVDCDKIHFKEGWVNAGQFTSDYDAHFIMDSSFSPSLHLDDVFYVPRTQTFNNCAIVNMGTSVNDSPCRTYINGLLAGAEDGRVALVNNFAKGNVGRGTYINIGNGSAFTAGAPVVRLMQLPNTVSFTNQSGGIDETHVESMVEFDTSVRSFATAEGQILAGVNPEIWFNGYTPRNFENLPRANLSTLNKYIRSKNKTFRNYMQGVTTAPTPVVFPAPVRFSKGKVWKIKATNFGNPGADRYTEIIIAGDTAGTTLSIVVIVQGTTVAPLFSVPGGVLNIQGTAGTNDFGIEIEQLVDATESFL
jgi:hypothetical protein